MLAAPRRSSTRCPRARQRWRPSRRWTPTADGGVLCSQGAAHLGRPSLDRFPPYAWRVALYARTQKKVPEVVKLVTPELFWSRVQFAGPDECAPYVGPGVRTKDGHVRISVNGRKIYAHRYSFLLANGFWPEVCRHACDYPPCANPHHLADGTQADNVADRERRNRRTSRLPRRPTHWSSRLTQQDLDELIEARSMGIRATVLANEYGVSAETVRSVWRRAAAGDGLGAAA